jgi:hypothetical protein
MRNLPMNMKFTLILFVNQNKSGFLKTSSVGFSEEEGSDRDLFGNHAPPERAVKAVLDYARSLEVADTVSIGKTEWMLN